MFGIKLDNISPSLAKRIAENGNFSSASQRLLLGATALATQPIIDHFNYDVDEKTRKYSVARTIVKIIVGTTVGVAVRTSAIRLSTLLAEKSLLNTTVSSINRDSNMRKNLILCVGDIIGLAACLCTNFLIDAPLTKNGLNYIVKKFNLDNKKGKSNCIQFDQK